MKLMFVCTGNTCRSAIAELIFKKISEGDIEVFSCGIGAENGNGPSENTIKVCNHHGWDITNHKATYFKDSNIEDMDLVLTFESFQKEKILIYYPQLEIFTIKEFIGEYPLDIGDPFDGSYEVYNECFLEISRVLNKVKEKIGC